MGKTNMARTDEIAITIVHGTGINRHEWAKSDSEFADYIRNDLPHRCSIETFPWSGYYTFRSRSIAAKDLANFVNVRQRDLPNAKHIIIAHSHGGNILLHALRDNDLRSRIAGIVLLSTPFLHINERPAGPFGLVLVGGFIFIILGLLSKMLMAQCGILQPAEWWHIIGTIITGVLIIVAVGIALKWQEWSLRWAKSIALPDLSDAKMLILRKPADEATLFLFLVQFLEVLINRIWVILIEFIIYVCEVIYRPWNWIMETTETNRLYKSGVFGFVVGAALVIFFLFQDRLYLFMEQQGIASTLGMLFIVFSISFWIIAFPVCLMVALLFIAILITIPFLFCNAILLAMIGPELALAAPFLDVSVEYGPPGKATIFHVKDDISLDGSNFEKEQAFVHAIYNDPQCRRVIIEWIKIIIGEEELCARNDIS